MEEKEFSDIKDRLLKLNEVKGVIYPTKETGFPKIRFSLADHISKNETTGKRETKKIEVPLLMKIVVCKDGQDIRNKISGIIGGIPYEIATLRL